MFFFIGGNSRKLVGSETVQVNRRGSFKSAEVSVYRSFISIFFIPLIPLGKKYSIYIPETGEYYEDGLFSSIPSDLIDICRQVGSRY